MKAQHGIVKYMKNTDIIDFLFLSTSGYEYVQLWSLQEKNDKQMGKKICRDQDSNLGYRGHNARS